MGQLRRPDIKYVRTKPQTGLDITEEREKAKTWLDTVSPSMCLAKWFHVSLHLTNGKTHSCYHPPTHNIDIKEIKTNPSALHNTQQKKKERLLMLEGKRPKGCQYCWNIEDTPGDHRSDRHYRSSEHWAVPYKELTIKKPGDHNVNPTYVEVNFNQACNFKCVYCSPHLSSEWEREIKEFGSYPTQPEHNNLKTLTNVGMMPLKIRNAKNPYVQAFWKWWPEMYKHLHVFRMTGGEPLMDKNTFKVMQYIVDNPKSDLDVGVTSNLCPPEKALFKKFMNALLKIQNKEFEVFVVALHDSNEPDHSKWSKAIVESDNIPLDTLDKFDVAHLAHIGKDWVSTWFDFDKVEKFNTNEKSYAYKLSDNKACKHFGIYVSVDSWGSRAEYIRDGLEFNTLLKNVKTILHDTHFTSISFINTFNLLSVTSVKDFLQGVLDIRKFVNDLQYIEEKNPKYNTYWNRQRVWFDLPMLRSPAWLSIQNLPGRYIKYIDDAIIFMENNSIEKLDALTGFSPFEIDKLKRNREWMLQDLQPEEIKNRYINFYLFFSEHDTRRNKNFIETFPEMEDYWMLCKNV